MSPSGPPCMFGCECLSMYPCMNEVPNQVALGSKFPPLPTAWRVTWAADQSAITWPWKCRALPLKRRNLLKIAFPRSCSWRVFAQTCGQASVGPVCHTERAAPGLVNNK